MKGLTNILWWICSWIAIFIFFYLLGSFLDNTYLGIFLFIILTKSMPSSLIPPSSIGRK